jgi:hypothetical protein
LLQQQKQETAMSIERLRAANQLEVESMKARNAALLETHKANLQPTPEF